MPSRDPKAVTICELRFNDDTLGSKLPSISVVKHYRWTGKPRTTALPVPKGAELPQAGCFKRRRLAEESRTSIAYPIPNRQN